MMEGKLKCNWKRDIDWCTGEPTGEMPFCPNCDEPLYETERCVFCGQEIEQDDEKLKEWLEPPVVETMKCFECGGTLEFIRSKYNGHRHGQCRDCGLRFME